jgi:ADP-ribose pyrophosphatase
MSDRVQDEHEQWPVESSEDLFREGLPFALRSDQVRMPDDPDGEPFTRVVLEHPGAAVILAVDEDQRVLCLRQYRHPVRRRMVELPAGLMDHEGEDPEQVARRELAEEAGLQAQSWTHLVSTYSSPGITEELMHVFLARDLSPADPAATAEFVAQHEEADMELLWVSLPDLVEGILDGRVSDAPVVIAVLVAQARGLVSHPDGS